MSYQPFTPQELDHAPLYDQFLHLDGSVKKAVETGQQRLVVVALLFVLAFVGIGARLFDLTVVQASVPQVATAPAAATQPAGPRADIVDRNGQMLATTIETQSLYANPSLVLDPRRAAHDLSLVLTDMSEAEVLDRLTGKGTFAWVKRHLSPREHQEVLRLGLLGLEFKREHKRIYPQGPLTSQLLGYVNVDNVGLAGLEQSLNPVLAQGGGPLRLSIDLRLQHVLAEELSRGIEAFEAIGGAAVLMDVNTAEVLALSSLPTFDPRQVASEPPEHRFNRATLGTYELGSVFKLFTAAIELDSGVVTLEQRFDASHPLKVSGRTIHDFHAKNRWLSLPEVLMYSSNIGAAQIGGLVGPDLQRLYLDRFGMTQATPLELPETAAPSLPAQWRPINVATVSFGHGIAVTPLHLASGVASLVNGGVQRPVTLLKRTPGDVPAGRQIITPETSADMRHLMRLVVRKGSGGRADVPGMLVGGKTGTAEKITARGYDSNRRIATFAAAFPMDKPRYVVVVMVDEPKPQEWTHGYATAGWVSAPVVGRVIDRTAALMGIPKADSTRIAQDDDMILEVSARGGIRAPQ